MTQPASLEEVDARLKALPDSLILGPTDERALQKILELRGPVRPASRARWAPRPMVRVGAIAAVLALVLLANALAVYYAPTYGRALAEAPGIGGPSGKILAAFGLSPADVTVVNDVSTSVGHTLKLTAGYADGLRTVLFVSVDGRGVTDNPKGFGMNPGDYGLRDYTVADQFGHSYQDNLVSTPNLLSLQPLSWPASNVGARLTLHVTSLSALWLGTDSPIRGDWTLHATLVGEPAHNLALPAPIRTGQAVYTFTSIRSSTTTLVIRWTVEGPAVNRVVELASARRNLDPNAPISAEELRLGADYFSPRAFDASGQRAQLAEWGTTFTQPATGELTVFIPGPGRYRIQLGDALTSDDEQRWIVVP